MKETKEVLISNLTKNEALDLLHKELTHKNINSLDKLLFALQEDIIADVLSEKGRQAYLKFLREELAYQASDLPKFVDSTELGRYFANKYSDLKQEELHIVCVDNDNRIIDDYMVSRGTVDRSVLHPRDIFRIVVQNNASGFFLAHNHPSGRLNPSPADLKYTSIISDCAKMMHIDFLDNFIVGRGQYLSFKEEQLM